MLKSNHNKLHMFRGTNLVSMSTGEAIGNRFWVEIELLITRLPLVVLVFSHQTLHTVDEREMIALQRKWRQSNESYGNLIGFKWNGDKSDLIIALTNLGQASIAQASTVSKKHSNAPCCNNYQKSIIFDQWVSLRKERKLICQSWDAISISGKVRLLTISSTPWN